MCSCLEITCSGNISTGIDKGVRDTQVSTSFSYNTLQQAVRPVSSASAPMNVVEGNLALHEIRATGLSHACAMQWITGGTQRSERDRAVTGG